jgi:hypothetical protein
MKSKKSWIAAIAVIAAAMLGGGQASAQSEAHGHIGHVMTAWSDTPEGQGLLPTAIAEANIAVEHASLAARKPGDLDWMKAHSGHVVNALDPEAEAQGPGLGYGVKAATEGTIAHIGFAPDSGDASDAVKLHAVHVATSAQNTLERTTAIIELARRVQAATAPALARPMVEEIEVLTLRLRAGNDANGDGTVSWEAGEGGLDQSLAHMGYMMDAEGLR